MRRCEMCGLEIPSTRARLCADCRHDVRSKDAKAGKTSSNPCGCSVEKHDYKFMIVKGGWRGRPVAGGRTK